MKTGSYYIVENIIQGNNLNSDINSYLKILAPLQFTLETRAGSGAKSYANILMASPFESSFYHFQNDTEIQRFNSRTPHLHDFYELMIVLDGEIQQQIEQTELTFQSGNCCLMNRNIAHKEIFHSETTLLFIGLSEELTRILSEDEQNVYFPEIECPGSNLILNFMTDNLSKSDTKEYLDFLPAISNKDWYRILHTLTDNILRAILFPRMGSTYIIKGMLLELFGYLSNPEQFHVTSIHVEADKDFLLFSHVSHLMEDTDGRITRSELEKALHYSGNYINSIVKKYTSLCLFDYGQTFCMKKAADMLLTSTASVTEIMEELNFTNTTHFYKCFQKHYHMTPKQYRLAKKQPQRNTVQPFQDK